MATRQNLTRMKSCCLPIGRCFLIVLQYGQNKVNAQEGEGQGEVGSPIQGGQEGPSREGMEAPLSSSPPIPSQRALTHERGGEEAGGRGREVGAGGKEAGGCGQVPIIIANPTVGPHGCGGWAIYVRSGGASQEEAPTDHRRQSPPEGIPPGW